MLGVTVQTPVSITAYPGLLQLLSLLLSACAPAWLPHSAIPAQPWELPAACGAQGEWMDEETSCWCWAGLSVRRQKALQLFL